MSTVPRADPALSSGVDGPAAPVENDRSLEGTLPEGRLEVCGGDHHPFSPEDADWTGDRLTDVLVRHPVGE